MRSPERHIEESESQGEDAASFTVIIENVGSVPAEVTKWAVSVMDLDGNGTAIEQVEAQQLRETLLGASLFPSQQHPVTVTFRQPGLLRTPLPLAVTVTVEYRGVAEIIYRTRVEVQRTPAELRQRSRAT